MIPNGIILLVLIILAYYGVQSWFDIRHQTRENIQGRDTKKRPN